ncbi:hypothetical protein AUEXF2481DRAFT_374301 [Aureobasidium subglaciale EXF-2481]|uniref:Uncharacterized protein n=1 Tax=Aureobasidium subglaciale (strain EXF-2481) TaxID=1043005 RepID=A0A074YM45_AURSE|nr:uncharacterized protein AUEXF2481DRAFT_374301 [Aureobasidium subglaciale EXF-2481]KEQ98760.1 hypothetical protein AUEXF2481DRAFT_374301 [Aureobasidium subglaciale EXF-2481]
MNRKCRSTDGSGMRQQGRAIGRGSRSVNKQALRQGRRNSRDGTRVPAMTATSSAGGWIANIASNAQRCVVGMHGPREQPCRAGGTVVRAFTRYRKGPKQSRSRISRMARIIRLRHD